MLMIRLSHFCLRKAQVDDVRKRLLLLFSLCLTINVFAIDSNENDGCNYLSKNELNTPVSSATVGDFVWNDFNRNGIQDGYEPGVKEVFIGLYTKGADGIFNTSDDNRVASTYTDNSGHYLFENVSPGEYVVKVYEFSLPSNFIFCPKNKGNDTEKDSNIEPTTGVSDAFMVIPQANHISIDAGIASACAGFIPNMTIGYGQILPAGGSPETLTILSPVIYHPEDYEFQWMRKVGTGPWAPVAGANEMTYTPGPVFQDTYYVLCYRIAGCSSSDYKESNVLLMEIGDCVADIKTDFAEYCADEAVVFYSGNMSVNLTYQWSAQGGVVSSPTGSTTSITWFNPGDYYVELTAMTANGCESTSRKLIKVVECNDYACCINGQELTELCYNGGGPSTICTVFVPCQYTDDLLATGQYSCGPCINAPFCGTGFFISSATDDNSDIIDAAPLGISNTADDDLVNNTIDTDITINDNFNTSRDLNVFPNPAEDEITLSIDTKYMNNRGKKITVQLIDMNSRLHKELVATNSAEVEQLIFDLSDLTDGLYIFRIINGDEQPEMQKFVKISQ